MVEGCHTVVLVSPDISEPILGLDWLSCNRCEWRVGAGVIKINGTEFNLVSRMTDEPDGESESESSDHSLNGGSSIGMGHPPVLVNTSVGNGGQSSGRVKGIGKDLPPVSKITSMRDHHQKSFSDLLYDEQYEGIDDDLRLDSLF